MTRIMCWNIENFDLTKIIDSDMSIDIDYGVTKSKAATERRAFILRTITGVKRPTGDQDAAPPDIFILIEIASTFSARGTICVGAGTAGAISLLEAIRLSTNEQKWMMIPPIQTGKGQAIAVYYNSASLVFTGPWHWSGGDGPTFDPNGLKAPQTVPYEKDVGATLPDGVIPEGLVNAGVPFRCISGAIGFMSLAKEPFVFHAERRVPLWITFADASGDAQTRRTYSLFLVHGPTGRNLSAQNLIELASIAEIVAPAAANDVKVVIGDTNYNLLDSSVRLGAAYQPLIDKGYALGLNVPSGNPPQEPSGYRSYFATTIKSMRTAKCWYEPTPGSRANLYPGYSYFGTDDARTYSVDNVLATFGSKSETKEPCGVLANVSILNSIIGSPYDMNGRTPSAAPTGYYKLADDMTYTQNYPAPVDPLTTPAFSEGNRKADWIQWNRYGHIRSTSDHLPIVADV